MFDLLKFFLGLPIDGIKFTFSVLRMFIAIWQEIGFFERLLLIFIPFLPISVYWATGQQYWEKKYAKERPDLVINPDNIERWLRTGYAWSVPNVIVPFRQSLRIIHGEICEQIRKHYLR